MVKARKELTPLGIIVKKKLIELNKTQRSLAKDIGINEFFLINILRGRQPGKQYIPKILRALNINSEEIRTEDES